MSLHFAALILDSSCAVDTTMTMVVAPISYPLSSGQRVSSLLLSQITICPRIHDLSDFKFNYQLFYILFYCKI